VLPYGFRSNIIDKLNARALLSMVIAMLKGRGSVYPELRMLGVGGALEFPDIPIEVFDWSLDVNLRGQFYFSHAAMKASFVPACTIR